MKINLIGVNQKGFEMGNSVITDGRDLPWLQDVDNDGDGNSDVWANSWPVEWRDVVILDENNVQIDVYNLTLNNLENPGPYETLKAKLIAAAEGVEDNPHSFSWTNAANPLDVNNDTQISPIDALTVINELNMVGGRALPALTAAPPAYIDTNGDGFVSPTDALRVINELNNRALANQPNSVAALPASLQPMQTEGESSSASVSSVANGQLAAVLDAVWSEWGERDRKRTELS